jgi:NAD(P)-dependent dehydrogenase (short-subunit alcohol dehydrogenase family)
MDSTLVIITGASAGIGRALSAVADEAGCSVATVSRRMLDGTHLSVDLSDPETWDRVGEWIGVQIQLRPWERVIMVHAAATLTPIGFAGEVDAGAYRRLVLLDCALPQLIGDFFLREMAQVPGRGILVQVSSGAASTVYPGWSGYCAAKAAVDMWVRVTGEEQRARGDKVKVLSVAPGVVATDMQSEIRDTVESSFPKVERFRSMYEEGRLQDPDEVAAKLWRMLERDQQPNGAVVDLRSAE